MSRPGPTDREPTWSKWLAQERGGVAEARTFDGSRVDVLTDQYAIEVEWVKKWKESIGQALYYAAAFGRKPGVILLTRGKPREELYYLRCLVVCNKGGICLETVSTRG